MIARAAKEAKRQYDVRMMQSFQGKRGRRLAPTTKIKADALTRIALRHHALRHGRQCPDAGTGAMGLRPWRCRAWLWPAVAGDGAGGAASFLADGAGRFCRGVVAGGLRAGTAQCADHFRVVALFRTPLS